MVVRLLHPLLPVRKRSISSDDGLDADQKIFFTKSQIGGRRRYEMRGR